MSNILLWTNLGTKKINRSILRKELLRYSYYDETCWKILSELDNTICLQIYSDGYIRLHLMNSGVIILENISDIDLKMLLEDIYINTEKYNKKEIKFSIINKEELITLFANNIGEITLKRYDLFNKLLNSQYSSPKINSFLLCLNNITKITINTNAKLLYLQNNGVLRGFIKDNSNENLINVLLDIIQSTTQIINKFKTVIIDEDSKIYAIVEKKAISGLFFNKLPLTIYGFIKVTIFANGEITFSYKNICNEVSTCELKELEEIIKEELK